MNISLPDQMKEWVEAQAATGQYANVSDYMRDVLRREQDAIARLQDTVDDALAGGFVEMSSDELFEDIKRRSRTRIVATAEEIKAESLKADDAA
jgi:antitoxin ParD1/3/4